MYFRPVVGLEIHLQVKTETKMFCRCKTDYFDKEANVNVCPVCLGFPGALPVPNKLALEKIIKLCLALNCTISQKSKFDRKNYFYPDLSKGYQISQFDMPIGRDGYVEIEIDGDSRRIRIQRVHLEEDTAKSIHLDSETLLDFNKSGIPLIEIVTYPDFASVEEVILFAKRLKQIVKYNEISDTEMQKGQMRFELNISVLGEKTEVNSLGLPNYKVEVKNIGSISVLEKVLNFEFERQKKEQIKGLIPNSQTRGLKGMSGETVFQRLKESADDYRYFPEPDIPPFEINQDQIDKIKSSLNEQPVERKQRYVDMGLEFDQADIFVEDVSKGDWFDTALNQLSKFSKLNPKEVAKWIQGDLSGQMEKLSLSINDLSFSVKWFLELLNMYTQNQITGSVVKKCIESELNSVKKNPIYKTSVSAIDLVTQNEWLQIDDVQFLGDVVSKVVTENSKIVSDIQRNPNAIKALVGIVMRESKGKLNPKVVESELRRILEINNEK